MIHPAALNRRALLPLLSASAMALTIASAAAQDLGADPRFWYFELRGGIVAPAELNFSVPPAFTGRLGHGLGPTATASVGTWLTDRIRAELQFNYGQVAATTVTGSLLPGPVPIDTTAVGGIRVFKLMAAGAYDIDVGLPRFSPYVGGGLGVIMANVESLQLVGMPGTIHGNPVVAAAQLSAGMSYALSNRTDFVLDYTAEFGMPARLTYTTPLGDSAVNTAVFGQTVQAGIRVRLR